MRPTMSRPSSRISPPSGATRPVMALNAVVFPAPFGPISPVMVRGPRSKLTPLRAATPPNRLLTLFRESRGTDFLPQGLPASRNHLPFDQPNQATRHKAEEENQDNPVDQQMDAPITGEPRLGAFRQGHEQAGAERRPEERARATDDSGQDHLD